VQAHRCACIFASFWGRIGGVVLVLVGVESNSKDDEKSARYRPWPTTTSSDREFMRDERLGSARVSNPIDRSHPFFFAKKEGGAFEGAQNGTERLLSPQIGSIQSLSCSLFLSLSQTTRQVPHGSTAWLPMEAATAAACPSLH
jgi:hypothetical protein